MQNFGLFALALTGAAASGEPGDVAGTCSFELGCAVAVAKEAAVTGTASFEFGTNAAVTVSSSGLSVDGTCSFELGTSATVAIADRMVVITRFNDLSGTWPATAGQASLECWGGGGGGTTATSSGGSGAYARTNAHIYTPGGGYTVTIGGGGAPGGGTGGDTSIDSVCVADGAAGATGGLTANCTGDVTRAGGNGALGAANNNGAGAPGSATGVSGLTPGDPDGGSGAGNNSAAIAGVPGGGGRSGAANQTAGAAGLARLIYTIPPDPNFAYLVSASQVRSSGTTHTAVVPSGAVGDLLVYIVGSDGNPTVSISGVDATIFSVAQSTIVTLAAFRHVATGADPTTITTSASEIVTITVLRFRRAGTPEGTATANTADPPSVTPSGGNGNYLTLALEVCDCIATTGAITARPTGYDESLLVPTASIAAGVVMCTAWKNETVVGSVNPGTYTSTGTAVAGTIVIPKV